MVERAYTRGGNAGISRRAELLDSGKLPKIVCLCGSTRFMDAFKEMNLKLTVQGYIVLTVGCSTRLDVPAEKKMELDELHKRKIDLADEVLVLNVDGYIGDSTRSEIRYARMIGVGVRYLEPLDLGGGLTGSL